MKPSKTIIAVLVTAFWLTVYFAITPASHPNQDGGWSKWSNVNQQLYFDDWHTAPAVLQERTNTNSGLVQLEYHR